MSIISAHVLRTTSYPFSLMKIVRGSIPKILENLNLNEQYLKLPLKLLSGGEQQRLAFLLLLLRNPAIYLLDEPTSFLDNNNKKLIMKMIDNLRIEGKTIIIATHDEDWLNYTENLFVLKDGTILNSRKIEEISKILKSELKIPGELIEDKKSILIPEIIFQQFQKETLYSLIIKDSSLLIIPLTAEEFKTKNTDSWFFFESNKLPLTSYLLGLPWSTKKFYWILKSNNVQIIFED